MFSKVFQHLFNPGAKTNRSWDEMWHSKNNICLTSEMECLAPGWAILNSSWSTDIIRDLKQMIWEKLFFSLFFCTNQQRPRGRFWTRIFTFWTIFMDFLRFFEIFVKKRIFGRFVMLGLLILSLKLYVWTAYLVVVSVCLDCLFCCCNCMLLFFSVVASVCCCTHTPLW